MLIMVLFKTLVFMLITFLWIGVPASLLMLIARKTNDESTFFWLALLVATFWISLTIAIITTVSGVR